MDNTNTVVERGPSEGATWEPTRRRVTSVDWDIFRSPVPIYPEQPHPRSSQKTRKNVGNVQEKQPYLFLGAKVDVHGADVVVVSQLSAAQNKKKTTAGSRDVDGKKKEATKNK